MTKNIAMSRLIKKCSLTVLKATLHASLRGNLQAPVPMQGNASEECQEKEITRKLGQRCASLELAVFLVSLVPLLSLVSLVSLVPQKNLTTKFCEISLT